MKVFGSKFLTVILFMRSWPGDILFLSILTIDRTYPGVVGEADSAMGKGDEMNWWTWSMWVESGKMWGLNVFARWLAKTSDFSWSVEARLLLWEWKGER